MTSAGQSTNDHLFISWVGLRGAVPVMLAIFPLVANLEQAQLLFNLAFVVVLVSLLFQGASIPVAARLFRVEIPPTPEPLYRTSLDLVVESDYELMIYQLSNSNWCVGVQLRDLKMPKDTRIAAVFRGKVWLHPTGSTRLELNDVLCVIGHALGDVGEFYGFDVPPDKARMTLAKFFTRQYGGYPSLGDRIEWQGLTWVVAAVEDDWILKVGLKLSKDEPQGQLPAA